MSRGAARCQVIQVDGDPVLVRVTGELTPEEIEALTEVIRAAKARAAESGDADDRG